MTAQDTIDRSISVITNRISAITKKIAALKEKYPEDYYGTRWMDKAGPLEEEKIELERYLKQIRTIKIRTQEEKDQLATLQIQLREYADALAQVDPLAAQALARRWRNQ